MELEFKQNFKKLDEKEAFSAQWHLILIALGVLLLIKIGGCTKEKYEVKYLIYKELILDGKSNPEDYDWSDLEIAKVDEEHKKKFGKNVEYVVIIRTKGESVGKKIVKVAIGYYIKRNPKTGKLYAECGGADFETH